MFSRKPKYDFTIKDDRVTLPSFMQIVVVFCVSILFILFAFYVWASTPCMEWVQNPETNKMVWSECDV